MARIVFYELEEWECEYIRKRLQGHELEFIDGHLTEENLRGDAEILCVFIYSKIDARVLDRMPRLRLVATLSTGYDHIDVRECACRNITVCNVPAYGENTVAEHTFALLLAISKRIVESVERTRRGNFSLEGLRGFDLKGKTIGVVGVGRIGRNVVRLARAFGMKVLAYTKRPDPKLAEELGFTYVATLEELLPKCDVVTLHAPLTEETHHMINKANIRLMKRGAVLINTARGELVDTEALLEAVENGTISAAGLDVLEGEANIKEERQLLSKIFAKEVDLKTMLEEHILLERENVLVTPHNAFNSWDALERILETTVENIDAFLSGKPVNVVKA